MNNYTVTHMWLAESMAKRYPYPTLEDAKQNGYEGLIVAAAKYNPAKGIAFSTYAYSWVKKYILLGAKRRETVELPSGLSVTNTQTADLYEAINQLTESEKILIYLRFIRELSVSELARHHNVSQPAMTKRIKKILEKMKDELEDE